MRFSARRIRGGGLVAGLLLALVAMSPGMSQTRQPDFPKRTVTVVVPMGAGAGLDLTTRMIAKRLEARLGQPFVVENKPGMAGSVGSFSVARSSPDGYTLLTSFLSANIFNPIIYQKTLQYKVSDLRFVSMLYDAPFMVAVSSQSDVKSFKELVAQLRDNPPRHSYASGGVGSAGHVGGAMLLRIVGAEGVVHVPYRTTAAFFPDLISNRVAFAVSTPDTMMSYVKAGQLRPLLIAGPKRLASLPDVPTSAEEGFPDLRVSSWYVVQAPAATPEDIVQLLNREVNAVLTEPEMQAWFSRSESIPMPGYTPEATRQYYEQERVRWEPYVIGSGAVAN